jgi:hypothetical protein
MALHDRIALQGASTGIRAELKAAGVYAGCAGGHPSIILSPPVPSALSACQSLPATSFRGDHNQPPSANSSLASRRVSVRTAELRG